MTSVNAKSESNLDERFGDQRLYFWLPRSEIAFLQSVVESTDNLARIRTERSTETKALVVLMFDRSQRAQVDDLLRYYEEESGFKAEIV